MPLSMQLSQRLSQKLIMTPQMQQSIKLLQMNAMDMETETNLALLENPFLELSDDSPDYDSATPDGPASDTAVLKEIEKTPDAPENPLAEALKTIETQAAESGDLESRSLEDQPEQFAEVDVDWGDTFSDDSDSDAGRKAEAETDWVEIFSHSAPRSYSSAASDEGEERSFEETVAKRSSLYDQLMWQKRVSVLNGLDADIADFLIGCIDDRGYLQVKSPLEECAKEFKTSLETVEEILSKLENETPHSISQADLERFAAEHLTGRGQKIAHYLSGYLIVARKKTGNTNWLRKPTIEACAELFGVEVKRVNRVLVIIQEFDPPGVGAQDLPECLLFQLAALEQLTPLAKEMLTECWALVLKKEFKKIARLLKEDEADVMKVFNQIRRLNPAPGLTYSSEQPIYITPDVYVREMDGRTVVYLNEGEVANLRLSNTYKNILLSADDAKIDPKEREYALEKYRAAVMFIKNIEKRRNTVMRVTEAIMEYQSEFLKHGVESLRPLALAEIAEQVGMHESTISRVTSNKYVDTSQGMFELKFFFSSAIQSDSGEATSSRSIKSKIKELISHENPRKPLSDSKIADALKEKGYSIARRTVAKYREQLKILPTTMRKITD